MKNRETSEPTSLTTCRVLCSLPVWEPKNKHTYPLGQKGQEDKGGWEGLPLTAKSWNKLGIMFPLAEGLNITAHCDQQVKKTSLPCEGSSRFSEVCALFDPP